MISVAGEKADEQAVELAGFLADRIDVPEGSITAHIGPEWDGSER